MSETAAAGLTTLRWIILLLIPVGLAMSLLQPSIRPSARTDVTSLIEWSVAILTYTILTKEGIDLFGLTAIAVSIALIGAAMAIFLFTGWWIPDKPSNATMAAGVAGIVLWLALAGVAVLVAVSNHHFTESGGSTQQKTPPAWYSPEPLR